jgi:TatD DNase family protein
MVENEPGLWCSVGIHPQHAHEEPVPEPEMLAAMTAHPKVIGLGESGLDYFYETAPHDVQQAGFRAHIRAARLAGVPLAIHARNADADIEKILREERDAGGPFDFLLHCFSSGRRNEPGWVAHTAATLAEVRGLPPEELAALTTANFRRLYPKAVAA